VPVRSVERKLAAVLAADVVGYSRLMGEDEDGTLTRLKEHRRELIDPTTVAIVMRDVVKGMSPELVARIAEGLRLAGLPEG
jgi:hypothetical protein